MKFGKLEQEAISSFADIGVDKYASLSNFTPREFIFQGEVCSSMEGLLQSLKFPLIEKQKRVRLMSDIKAKRTGKKKKWYLDQKLYFLDEVIDRHSQRYQEIVDQMFDALYEQDAAFREELSMIKGLHVIHSHGCCDPRRTILTEDEFLKRLIYLANK